MMKRALILAMVTGVLGGVAVSSPAAAAVKHGHGHGLCIMDSPEC